MAAVAFEGVDALFGSPAAWALGDSLGRPGAERHQADTASGIAVALTKNRLTPDFSAAAQLAGLVTDALAGQR